MKLIKTLLIILTCMATTGCMSIISCFDDVRCIWDGGSGVVPDTTPTPTGFNVSPATANMITTWYYGPRKNVWHIYADSKNYYIIDGYLGSNSARAKRSGLIINGITGEIFDRQTGQWLPSPLMKAKEYFDQTTPTRAVETQH